MSSSDHFSMKLPPKFEKDEEYESWKRDLFIWRELTDLAKCKQALAVHLSLKGRARVASSEVAVEALKQENGVETLIAKLDKLFLQDEGSRQFNAFREFYNLRKSDAKSCNEYISEFEHVYFKLVAQKMALPDSVIAFMLLESCKFNENEIKMVMTGIPKVTFDNMKEAIKRIFGSDIGRHRDYSKDVKTEPVFEAETNETLYSNRNWRHDSWRETSGRGFRGTSGANSRGFGSNRGFNRKTNPIDRDGKISKCSICESKFHWARQCPDAYEKRTIHAKNVGEQDSSDKVEGENEVHLSLFVGYTNNEEQCKKLNTLVEESHGCALLDTGCSTTVTGNMWLKNYLGQLSEYDRSCIIEYPSNATFTFGDGATKRSIKKMIMPCYINGKRSTIETDVVSCDIPLLLSRKSMKKGKMIIDFGYDSLTVGGNKVKLESTNSGHYLLPLSF